jgi:hypothetical protein
MKFCPECGKPLPSEVVKFCPECGFELARAVETVKGEPFLQVRGNRCPMCGYLLQGQPDGSWRCVNIGCPGFRLRTSYQPFSYHPREKQEQGTEVYHERTYSQWWYLLPILFGFIGGMLAYLGVRDEDHDAANTLLGVGIAVSVLAWLPLLLFLLGII